MTALWDLTAGTAGTPVAVAAVDEAIGRGRGDMRTPLNLRSLADEGIAEPVAEGAWALTAHGVATIAEDRELSDR